MMIVYFHFILLTSKVYQKIEEGCLMVNVSHVEKHAPQDILLHFIAVCLIG